LCLGRRCCYACSVLAIPMETIMPGSALSFYCPGCGNRLVQKAGKINPNCGKCGVLLVEGEPAKPGKLGPILLLAGLAVVLGIVLYVALK
jgi:hypothetical protein